MGKIVELFPQQEEQEIDADCVCEVDGITYYTYIVDYVHTDGLNYDFLVWATDEDDVMDKLESALTSSTITQVFNFDTIEMNDGD